MQVRLRFRDPKRVTRNWGGFDFDLPTAVTRRAYDSEWQKLRRFMSPNENQRRFELIDAAGPPDGPAIDLAILRLHRMGMRPGASPQPPDAPPPTPVPVPAPPRTASVLTQRAPETLPGKPVDGPGAPESKDPVEWEDPPASAEPPEAAKVEPAPAPPAPVTVSPKPPLRGTPPQAGKGRRGK
jgi:hypothetical protein